MGLGLKRMDCHFGRGVEFTVMRVVGDIPDVSADMSGGTSGGVSGGFKICMYGKSGGFASRPSGQPKIPNKIIICPEVYFRVLAKTGGDHVNFHVMSREYHVKHGGVTCDAFTQRRAITQRCYVGRPSPSLRPPLLAINVVHPLRYPRLRDP
jgi:hypothetical protein